MFEAKQLTKIYQDRPALDGLNLQIAPGEIFCLLGQNGAGKTTTINLFLGFLRPTSGEAYINGLLVKPDDLDFRQYIAYIPEVVMLYPQLTGTENLDFFSKVAGFRYSKKKLHALLEMVGLQDTFFSKRVGTYSKGMRQKVGIAIALAKDARCILMDEPTSGLDPKASHEFSALVRQLGAEGRAVLMATHDVFNAVEMATRLGIMRQGKLVHTLEAVNISARELQALYMESSVDPDERRMP